ncbi:hypothetical protein [Sphingomonas sp.]|uniref:hypothetical protein n=1 Tax=Sphingomonas sp. TaxID=28214 RepID=UPI002E376FD6|nr:hypothetical protein [Sphingomonas sp.]HEX4695277.1 hypothetical protein [Sphingomonas sp.]
MTVAILLASTPATAQTKPVAPASATAAGGTCAALAREYEGASMDLAANYAEGVGDNSAPRATLRAMEDANTLARAHMTLDLMRDFRCTTPKNAPDSMLYLSAALNCATDRLKGGGTTTPPSCDRSTWQKMSKSGG